MTVSLPLVFVLGVIAWAAIRFLGVRLWVAVVIALFGFWLSHTFLAHSRTGRSVRCVRALGQ